MKKIITFCGHTDFQGTKEHELLFLDILEKEIGNCSADMYLGGYGGFDEFAYQCCLKFKKQHDNISLIFVTPYITESYQENYLNLYSKKYDYILYPEIESRPLRFAITYRNRYMVEKADLVIAFINHTWGGAYETFKYAKRKGKTIFNIGKI